MPFQVCATATGSRPTRGMGNAGQVTDPFVVESRVPSESSHGMRHRVEEGEAQPMESVYRRTCIARASWLVYRRAGTWHVLRGPCFVLRVPPRRTIGEQMPWMWKDCFFWHRADHGQLLPKRAKAKGLRCCRVQPRRPRTCEVGSGQAHILPASALRLVSTA
jgi:hypothetical protein